MLAFSHCRGRKFETCIAHHKISIEIKHLEETLGAFSLRCPKSVLNACFRSPKRVHFYCGEHGRFEVACPQLFGGCSENFED